MRGPDYYRARQSSYSSNTFDICVAGFGPVGSPNKG